MTQDYSRGSRRRRRGALRIGALAAIPGFLLSCTTMERRAGTYVRDMQEAAPTQERPDDDVITEADLQSLPPLVQQYFEFARVVGKPRIDSFGFVMEGRIRQSRDAAWMPFVSRQYNDLRKPSRVYYINAKNSPMTGIDSYLDGKGRMHIKLFNLVTVGDSTGPEMDRAALVTFLNDLMVSPNAYFSVPVQWRQIDDSRAELSLTHADMTVTATLTFDGEGRIVHWESSDRYAEIDGAFLPDRWSTPIEEYGELRGMRVPAKARGVHDVDGNPYTYVELNRLTALEWNPTALPDAER